jgi:polysaccharide export outer membrane protein
MNKIFQDVIKSKRWIPIAISSASIFLWVMSAARGEFPVPQQESSIPVSDYRIGSKDLLEIKVFELPELNQTVRVSEDGSINFSLIGTVGAAGLTAQELEKKLVSILNKQYTQNAHVTVFIKEYQKVAVLGAVNKPGTYELVGTTTLLQIIAQAGGLTAQTLNDLFIYRKESDGKQIKITIKLEDLILNGKQELNIEIQPKDVITIPIDQIQRVFVYGEVKTPGVIQFMSSKKITLLQAIAQAGGLTEWASKSRVMIKKKEKNSGKEMNITVNLKKLISLEAPDVLLEDGDIVIVP